ncbi:MAG: DUF1995 family protein [Leptolyngbyaceae bacterium]|nr:DUF1995 family protein [Leptolyngbyaceae bacterium]
MTVLPDGLDEAIAQAKEATIAALADGWTRIQVELVIPELKIMPVAEKFLPAIDDRGAELRVFFPDPGAAALARRDWGEKPYAIRGINDMKAEIQPEETLFLFIEPSSIEVEDVEKLCNQAGDRPVIFLNPRLEDVATIGIGYAARQLRERFLNAFDSCYYICALEGALIFRQYPSPWQVWQETESGYEHLADFDHRPTNDELDQLFAPATNESESAKGAEGATPQTKKRGFFGELQKFLRALSQ